MESLPLAQPAVPYAYRKVGGDPTIGIAISRPVSQCELRAANYLSAAIGNAVGSAPALSSDVDIRGQLDIDFVAFGGPLTNFKSYDCHSNPSNRLATVCRSGSEFTDPKTQRLIGDCSDRSFDYGLILKVHPKQFQSRTWIACSGFGEWGTSGAAWYLANKWRNIQKGAKDRPFAIIVRVRPLQDESAEEVWAKYDEP